MKNFLSIIICLFILCNLSACTKNNTLDKKQNLYSNAGVTINKDDFPENTTLKVETLNENVSRMNEIKNALPNTNDLTAYEITAENLEGQKVQPNGSVKINFPVPSNYDSEFNKVVVYYVSDDAKTIEYIDCKVDGNNVVANVTHFSTYVVGLEDLDTSENSTDENEDVEVENNINTDTNEDNESTNNKQETEPSYDKEVSNDELEEEENNNSSNQTENTTKTITLYEKTNYYGMTGYFGLRSDPRHYDFDPTTVGLDEEDYEYNGQVGSEYFEKNTRKNVVFYYFTNNGAVMTQEFWADLDYKAANDYVFVNVK